MNKNEMRRLKKALKDKNEDKLLEWAILVEEQCQARANRIFKQEYDKLLTKFMEVAETALLYVLHFSESTKFGQKRLLNFWQELEVTIDLLANKEYELKEYQDELMKDKIYIKLPEMDESYKTEKQRVNDLMEEYDNKLELLRKKYEKELLEEAK